MRWLYILPVIITLAACETDDLQNQKLALTLAPESMSQHQVQMRRYDTKDESTILSATAGVLQDLGFIIDEAAPKNGLIVASKDRSAIEAQQVAGKVFLSALLGALRVYNNPEWDQIQKIRTSVVTKLSADKKAVVVHVTFQRILISNKRNITGVETINDATIYQQFFDKLSQAIFLEAHQI